MKNLNMITLLCLLLSIPYYLEAQITCASTTTNGSAAALNLYWVGHLEDGGGGNWSDPCSWRLDSVNGTERPLQAPRPVDNIFFDSTSFTAANRTVQIDADGFCASLTMDPTITNAFTLSGTGGAGRYLAIGSATNGGFNLIPSSTLTLTYTGEFRFVWGGTHDVDFNDHNLPCKLRFNGATGVFNLVSDLLSSSYDNHYYGNIPFLIQAGTFNSNNHSMDLMSLSLDGGVCNLGTSIVTLKGGMRRPYSSSNTALYTSLAGGGLQAANATLNFMDPNSFQGIRIHASDQFGDVNIVNAQYFSVAGVLNSVGDIDANTSFGCPGFTTTGDFKVYGNKIYTLGGNISVGSITQMAPISCATPMFFKSSNSVARVITSATNVNLQYAWFERIRGGNSASGGCSSGSITYTITDAVDIGGNTCVDLIEGAPQTIHWTGAGGDSLWSNASNWDLGCVPTPVDSVVFDNMTNKVVNLDVVGYCRSMTWVSDGSTGEFISPNNNQLYCYGFFTLNPTMNWNLTSDLFFLGENSTMDYSTQTLDNNIFVHNFSSYTLLSNLMNSAGKRLEIRQSSLTSVGHTIEIGKVYGYWGSSIFNLDNTTINLLDDTNAWYDYDGNFAVNPTNGSIVHFMHAAPQLGSYSSAAGRFVTLPPFTTQANSTLYARIATNASIEVLGDALLRGNAYLNGHNANGNQVANITVNGDLNITANTQVFLPDGASKKLTITGDINALGTSCLTTTIFKTITGGQIECDIQGTANLANVAIGGLDADGYTGQTVTNGTDLSGNDNWTIAAAATQTYYWRGDMTAPTAFNGNWDDANHWTTNVANTVGDGACVPTPADNVVFDNLSFSGSQTTVSVSGITAFHDLTITGSNVKWDGLTQIYCTGSMVTDATWSGNSMGNSSLTFSSSDVAGETISIDYVNFPMTIYFASNGTWTLGHKLDIHGRVVYFNKGNFHSAGFDVESVAGTSGLIIRDMTTMDLGNSKVYTKTWNTTQIGASTVFTAPDEVDFVANFWGEGLTYNNVHGSGTTVHFRGDGGTYKKVSFENNSYIYGSSTFDTIQYNAQVGVTKNHFLEAGQTQTLTSPDGQLIATGYPSGFLAIRSTTNAQSHIFKAFGSQMCVDYVNLYDIDANEDTDMGTTPTPTIYGGLNNSQTDLGGTLWDFTRGVFAAPTLNSGGDQEFCRRQTAYLEFTLGDDGPYDIIYDDGSTTDTIKAVPHGVGTYYHPVTPSGTTTYSVVGIYGDNCGNKISGTVFDATQTISFPTADVLSEDGDQSSCYLSDDNEWITFVSNNASERPIVSVQDVANGQSLGPTTAQVTVDASVQTYDGMLHYMQRHFGIEVDTNDQANVRFYFTDAELQALSTAYCGSPTCLSLQNLVVRKYDNNQMDFSGATSLLNILSRGSETTLPTDVTTTANVHYIEVETPSFSHFIIIPDTSATLPISLVDFKATAVDKKVRLNWITQTEINNDYFTIERSADGLMWEAIEEVKGAGNAVQTQYYNAWDNMPYEGTSYYRLKQTDFDGTYSYSPIRAVSIDGLGQGISMFPNPAKDQLVIQSLEEKITAIQLFDALGKRVVLMPKVATNTFVFNVEHLLSGIYTVQIQTKGKTITKKLTIH